MRSEVIVSLVLILPNWLPEGKNPLMLPPIVSNSNNVPYTPVNTGYLYDRQDVILIRTSQLMRQRVYFNVYDLLDFFCGLSVHVLCSFFYYGICHLLKGTLYISWILIFFHLYTLQVLFWYVIYLCLNLLSYSHCNMYVIPM